MKAANIINTILTLTIVMPIWFYLLYTLLKGINASELTWFLFWVYIPVAALCRVISVIVERSSGKEGKPSLHVR